MTANAHLSSVRAELVRLVEAVPRIGAVAIAPAGRRVSGKPIKGAVAQGFVVYDDMETEQDEGFALLAREHLSRYLFDRLPEAMTVGVVVFRDGHTIRVMLALTRIDETGEHPIHESVVDGKDGPVVGKIGSLLVDIADVEFDGSLSAVSTTVEPSGRNFLAKTPLQSFVDGTGPSPLAAAMANLSGAMATEPATGREILDWMDRALFGEEPKRWVAASVGSAPSRAAYLGVPKSADPKQEKRREPRLRVDLGKVADVLRSQQRPAWLLDVRPGEHDEPGIVGSGGAGAFIPQGEAWPTFEGEPMTPILQMDVAAFPEPLRGFLGGEGLYQLFAIEEYSEDPAAFLNRVVPKGTPGEWTPAPANAIPGRVIAALREVVEGPNVNEHGEGPTAVLGKRLSENQQQILEIVGPTEFGQYHADPKTTADAAAEFGLDLEALTVVAGLLTHYDTDKVGGWPSWAQAPEWPGKPVKSMVPLLNLRLGDGENDEVPLAPQILAGDGALQVFVSIDGKHRFATTWACG